MSLKKAIWDCKIGEIDRSKLPDGSDAPMRKAVAEAYHKLTGEWPRFHLSGWGGKLTKIEREVVDSPMIS